MPPLTVGGCSRVPGSSGESRHLLPRATSCSSSMRGSQGEPPEWKRSCSAGGKKGGRKWRGVGPEAGPWSWQRKPGAGSLRREWKDGRSSERLNGFVVTSWRWRHGFRTSAGKRPEARAWSRGKRPLDPGLPWRSGPPGRRPLGPPGQCPLGPQGRRPPGPPAGPPHPTRFPCGLRHPPAHALRRPVRPDIGFPAPPGPSHLPDPSDPSLFSVFLPPPGP